MNTKIFVLILALSFSIAAVAQNLESVSGSIFPAVEDHFVENKAVHGYHVIEDKTSKTLLLRFPNDKVPDEIKNLKPGSKVKIKGKKSNSSLEFNQLESSSSSSTSSSSSSAMVSSVNAVSGQKNLLAVRVQFLDASSVCSEAAAFSTLLDESNPLSVKNFYQSSSKGLLDFSGEVASVTIPVSISQTSSCDYSSWANLANTALSQLGYNLSSFQNRMYLLPGNVPCGWSGLANLNGGNSWIKACSAHVMTHELGHNIGLGHASTETSEYGDGSDSMGNQGYREFNGPHKSQLGWIPSGKEITIGSSGTFRISPTSEDPSLGAYPQVIKIFKADTNEYYYLSYRTRIGSFDSGLSTMYADKLNITRYKGTGYSRTFFINALSDGQSYALPSTNIVVTNIARTSSYLEVSIASSDICNEVAPNLAISSSYFLSKQNSSLASSISLTNASSPSCASSIYDLSVLPLTNITGVVSPGSLTLLPSASANANFNLAIQSMPDGIYNVSIKAVNRANSSLQSTKVVQVQIDNTAPTAPSQLTASLRTKNSVNVEFSPSSDNVSLSHYKIIRNGDVIATTSSNLYINTGVGSGTYTYQVIAVDSAGNESPASNSAVIVVGKPGGGKPRR